MSKHEQWYMVIDAADGRAVSIGTDVSDPLPEGLEAVPISTDDATAILCSEAIWDAATRAVVIPPPPVPGEVDPWKLALYLLREHGLRPAQVEAAIDAIPDDVAREEARISWRMQRPIPRASPLVGQIASGFGLTAAQVDEAYRQAATYA